MTFLKRQWFLVGMFLAIFLAWLFPTPGAQGGWLHPELLTKIGVALIFFLHGMALSFAAMKQGALNWRLHLVVQVAVFVVFPLLGLLLMPLTKGWMDEDLQTGLFYMCALPSTVSSSVAFTSAAWGNVPGAVFNATLSSILGIVLTPLWMKAVAGNVGASFPLEHVMIDLLIWLVLPLVLGQLSRFALAEWAKRNKSLVGFVDRGTILLLVYTSFCDSMEFGVWTQHGLLAVGSCFVIALVLFWILFFAIGATCDALGFSPPDRIAAIFCGSKKSLATGVPMAQLMFGAGPSLALILLPIMIYHPLQLIICGTLASRWKEKYASPLPAEA
ncbi:bile acid:sodium symporter family protein [Bremerella sp. JC817]|uniref:bile acid:sodium symporter family protein n=1 Tax=Bremerella sp. JC817 TaxID=3231756 RepID=UPI0034584948